MEPQRSGAAIYQQGCEKNNEYGHGAIPRLQPHGSPYNYPECFKQSQLPRKGYSAVIFAQPEDSA